MVLDSSPVAVTSPSDFAPASSKEFLDIQATIECDSLWNEYVTWQEHTVRTTSLDIHTNWMKGTFISGEICETN